MTVGADQISLKLRIRNNRIERVDIESKRTTMAARILEGKSPAEACKLLPLLFSLCSTAQLQAGLGAFEASLGYIPSPAHMITRKIMLHAEGLSEHLTRILIDWANLAAIESDVALVRQLRQNLSALKTLLYQNGQADTIGGASLYPDDGSLKQAVDDIAKTIQQKIWGQNTEQFLSMDKAQNFMDWIEASPTIPAQCLKQWMTEDLVNGDWPEAQILPSLDLNYLNDHIDSKEGDAFIARPTYKGQTAETGPFARQLNHDLIKDMVHHHGSGPLSRFAAKLVDLAIMMQDLQDLAGKEKTDHDLFHTKALHQAVGQVEAVRGQLFHRVFLDPETDIIERYRILAPTEWNFHPDGPLKQALLGLDATEQNKIKRMARLAVLALDPCVASEIVIEEA